MDFGKNGPGVTDGAGVGRSTPHALRLTPHLFTWYPVWRRNYLVWKKLALPSLIGNLGDPVFYLLGMGYGLSGLLPTVDGVPYLNFLAVGTACYSVMNSATFETLYSAFSRMHVQKTWEAILNTPLGLRDVLLGELFWATSKSMLSGTAIMLVIWVLGLYADFGHYLLLIPVIVLTGFCFSALGLAVNAVSPNYDFFIYYFTLAITPMVLLGGVFYPPSALPVWMTAVAAWLPLTHAIDLARPLALGHLPTSPWLHIAALLAYGLAGFSASLVLTRRRLLR